MITDIQSHVIIVIKPSFLRLHFGDGFHLATYGRIKTVVL